MAPRARKGFPRCRVDAARPRVGLLRSQGRRRPVWLIGLALAVAACTPAGEGPTSAGARDIGRAVRDAATPGAELSDTEFAAFLSHVDLRKALGARADEVIEQLERGRAAVANAARKPSALRGSPRHASLAAAPSLFMSLLFAETFGSILDPMTGNRGAGGETRPDPYTSTSEGATARTTTTLNVTTQMSASGSRVQLAMHWLYKMTTVDKTSGAVLFDGTDDRTMVGVIDVCPGDAGEVPASLNTNIHSVATVGGGATTTRTTTTSNTFEGRVDDQAVLRGVTQQLQDTASWEGASSGHWTASASMGWGAGEAGIGGPDQASFKGSFAAEGGASAAEIDREAGQTVVVDGRAVDPAYKEAQRLWRNGRCVVVVAPDYGAETPLAAADQQKAQHDEAVDASSETKFSVRLRHRFAGGALAQPVAIALVSGGKSVAPGRLDATPGAVAYGAPEEDEKKATVQLRSMSKRGIGTLVLDFHTGALGLTLTIAGSLSGSKAFPGVGASRISDTVSIGPLEFKKKSGDVWSAAGTWRSQLREEGVALGASMTCTGSEGGTVTMEARIETRTGKKVWVLDPLDAVAEGAGSLECTGGIRETESAGGSAEIFVFTLGEIVIPNEGGRIPLRGSHNDGVTGDWQAQATATATTKK